MDTGLSKFTLGVFTYPEGETCSLNRSNISTATLFTLKSQRRTHNSKTNASVYLTNRDAVCLMIRYPQANHQCYIFDQKVHSVISILFLTLDYPVD
jgi:hypothetical protein